MPRRTDHAAAVLENFWSVGGPGPCGPDSEIYYDWGEEAGCGEPDCAPACTRCERFLEFWNLVFMEYELHPDGTLTPLPEQNIDTGLGLERIAQIVQQVPSVYDTDGYQTIMAWIEQQSGIAYGDSADATKAHRVLADHARGMTFMVAEGVAPSNEARGYVLRRIIRRAVQHGLRIGLQAPFLAGLSDTVVEQMGDSYPEVAEHRDEIHRVLTAEEERFAETLERGMKLFDEAAAKGAISGDDAFTLQATYGFPLELTTELGRERGIPVDDDRARELMEEHREISRAGVGADGGRRASRKAKVPTSPGTRRPRSSRPSWRTPTSARASSRPVWRSRRSTPRAAARSATRAGSRTRRRGRAPSSCAQSGSSATTRS